MPGKIEVRVGGAILAGEVAGTGTPVVFLHAGVADKRMWQPQTADLSDTYQTITYDRRGFGETKTPDEPFSHVEDLRAVLDQLGLAKAALVGCSQGGRVAIDFTLAYPQRVARLALIAPAVSGAPAPGSLPPGVAELDQQMDAAAEAGDIERLNEIEAQLWLDGPAGPAGRVGGELRDLFLDMNGIALRIPELQKEIEPSPAYERAGQLALPVFLIWGDRDFPHVIERCHYLRKVIPGARGVEIPGTAHLPNLENPQLVNDLLRSFLS